MKTKKLKSTKCGSIRRKVPSDVSPTTSLPPLVEGQLRCFLRVTVSRVLWTVPKPSPTTFIRLRWWGESSNGTHFRPRDGSQTTQKTVKSTARFPIRCGPKQFTSYLTDMGSLVLEVLTKPEHLPIARAQVAGISCLSLSHSISGFFTLVSPTSEKLGELQVSLALEALTETYDSSCSFPTTDMSIETTVSAFRSTVKPASQPNILVVPSLSRPLSVNSGKESGSNTPRGKDHLYFQNAQTEKKTDLALENQKPTSSRSQHGQGAANPTVQESTHGQTTNDILSVILERGSKLRNAMVVSALKSDMDSELALKDTPLPLPKDNIGAPPMPSIPPRGRLLQNILHADSSLLQSPHSPPDYLSPDGTAADTENRAVDLLLGSLNGSALPIWDGEGSPPDSFLSVYGDSELNDPQYDQSLLENLFYKAPMSNSSPSDDDKDGPSPKKNLKKRGDDKELRHSGPKKSGGLDSENVQTPGTGDMLPGLCMDQLTVLGEVRLARVVIHSLTVPADSTTTIPKKTSGKGKPPRPLSSKKCSYFVEYLFPVASSRHDPSQALAAEVTRVFSSKVTGGVVNFQQRNVFPVHFSGSTIEQWWGTELTFNIYFRNSSQKKPVAIGMAVFPLRCLLQREQLSQTIILPVQSLQGTGESQDIGPLKVSLELAADNKNFSSANGQRSAGASYRAPSHALTSPQREASPSRVDMTTIRPQHHNTRGEDIPLSTDNNRYSRTGKITVAPQEGPSPLTSLQTSHDRPQAHQVVEEDSGVLLHALLMVPNGKDFSCGPMQPPNVYLNCKLFGQDETSRSVISWGQANPSFNFVQVAPVALTSRLLERMRNNVMVIEVWQRAGSLGQDRLRGLVKLPLHQFYMSFRDPKISHLLLQAQYPVLGVDSYMPVIDVFSGIIKGNLRVLLAMGLSVQIVSLQHMRDEELGSVSHLPRPAHLLDHQPHKVKPSPEETMREHLFVVRVERVKGLTPLQSTVWGEADCYVQYTFPTQEEPPAQSLDPNLLNCSVNLRQFRTTTTLCVPDPVFGHSESHVLLAPVEVPVQRLLLSSFSSQGLANGGGIPFEVWCRYYYPNVRDQLVAKGMLPLSKLCAMVTMQRQQPTEAQVFSLPLMPRTDSPAGHQPQPSGLLDVFVHYKQRPLISDVRSGGAASRVVTMVVQVHRAAGLQAAARALSEQDETFQYYADVGVNVYVTAHLSFLPESERRSTRVAARTFCPEFDHHTEFPCELQVQRSSGETCSLAELLQEATAVFTVWNRDSRMVMVSPRSKNTLLGTVRIQLADLIHKRTGISGWFGVSLPKDLTSSPRHHIFVGGLDISINFAHHADRERVITAAQGLGWEVGREEEEEELPNEGDMWAETPRTVSLTMSMPRAWLPVHCLLLPGHSELQRSTYCYFRYKLYDGEAFCSQLRHPGLSVEKGGGGEEGLATVAFRGSRTVELRSSQPLLWYLREEKLEIQMWVAFGKDRRPRPHDMDRLVGSAFVDLSSLAMMARHKLNLSGVYPLFRRSAPDLSGAALRVHITLTPGSLPEAHTPGGGDSQDQENCDSQGEEEEGGQGVPSSTAAVSRQSGTPSRHQTKSSVSVEPSQPFEVSMEDTFTVTITVDRAMHLSLKGCPLAERSGVLPSCWVSYITTVSAEPVTTALIADSHCPIWDHQQECRLSKQLLLDPQQSLVFKVWHKGDVERVIGFASVDLSPLLSGFQSVCGWYNITDFNGQCQGQLKVSVSPLKGVQELRGQRQAVCDGNKDSSALFQTLPLYYHTTATYSSFPSHVSRYTEQRINSTPHLSDRLLPERSSECDRHDEHMDRVRLYHQSLQEGGGGHPTSAAAVDAHPSSSVLFSALRKNLSELDDIQRYFSHKLSTPTFPSQSEQGQRSRLDEHQVTDTDSSQLLLKSTRLVGEVNNLISVIGSRELEGQAAKERIGFGGDQRDIPAGARDTGLQGHYRMETIPSSPKNISTTPPVPDDHHLPEGYETFPQSAPCIHKASGSPQEDLSPVPSPVPCMYQEHSDFQADEEEEDKAPASEDDGGGPREEEEDGDYEETVVEPRPLNEFASLTDRTSPWTSLLSDPDLASLESLETPEERQALDYSYHPSLTQQEGERSDLQTDTLQAWRSSEAIGSRLEEREQHVNSEFSHGPDTDEEEDTVSDGERTLQTSDNEAALHQESITAALHEQSLLCSGETASRVPGDREALSEVETSGLLYDTAAFSEEDTEHVVTSDTYQPETFLHKEDNRKSKHSDPVEIPNFFLSSHHMEASMRALRIAPVFPLASSDPKKSSLRHGILCRRVPRPRPNIPPSSMKKEETKRIAKIFASHFKD
uniref:C2 domain-containing protein 3 isoform X1 n=1 Tax=Oncorhynchus gorbuscha TaxID=8017 RepID=UPI001EAED7D5|nr:C2 domain-containing protein 3 isoform X1 [Oncorhynchus gorbuscha]